jgi:hypothetical protein
MKYIIITVLLIMTIGCAAVEKAIENYEIGDISKLITKYCAEDNELDRKAFLTAIRLIDKDYKPVCEEQD